MIRICKFGIAFVMVLSILSGCDNPFVGIDEHERYKAPGNLADKLYSQIRAEEDLATFTAALEITGYDEIFDKSGSYTIFAPTDSAFESFFQENSLYGSLEEIPAEELKRIVKFLTLQSSWNERQFRELSANDGWGSNETDDWKTSFIYKKETILEEDARKIWLDEEGRIVDSIHSNGDFIFRQADYRKFMPVFTREYFSYNDLDAEDYKLYFNRDIIINDDIYVAEAKIQGNGIFAANGFIYKLDKVVLPLDNTEEYLEKKPDYSFFLALLREFSQGENHFSYQIGNFQLGLEKINTQDEKFAMFHHAGIIIPTNRAYIEFIENYLLAQGGMDQVSYTFKREIANSFYLNFVLPVFTEELENGFYNYNKESVALDPEKIIETQYTSNATLIGYDDFIVPNIFTSVGAPTVLSNKYRLYQEALLTSRANFAIKAQDQTFAFYIVPDTKLEEDSSLYISDINNKMSTFDRGRDLEVQHSANVLRTRILNQVGIGIPSGTLKKEFIPNLAGNYIVAERKEDGSILLAGKEPSTFGFNQPDLSMIIDLYATEITGYEISNGKSYEVDGWFNYSYKAADGIVNRLQYTYPWFFEAIRNTGYLSLNEREILFYNEDLQYTIFVPSEDAFGGSGFDDMSSQDQKTFVKNHFIVGKIIFTDGKEPSQNYPTASGTSLNIDPGQDLIHIRKPDGEIYYTVEVTALNTNVMLTTAKPDHEDDQEFTSYATTAVLHEIDTVLLNSIFTIF